MCDSLLKSLPVNSSSENCALNADQSQDSRLQLLRAFTASLKGVIPNARYSSQGSQSCEESLLKKRYREDYVIDINRDSR